MYGKFIMEFDEKYPYFEDISSEDDDILSQASERIEKYEATCATTSQDFSSDDDLMLSQEANEIEKKYGRFSLPKTESEMMMLGKRQLADSTKNKMKWAVNTYKEWVENRNAVNIRRHRNRLVFKVNLEEMSVDEMNKTLSRFVTEVRKVNGADYPGSTLYEMITSLQLHLEQCDVEVNFFSDPAFIRLKNTLDAVMRQRRVNGIGNSRRQAQVITEDEEDLMWRRNILGSETAKQLQDTILYLLGINFALRAAKEHHALRMTNSQLYLTTDSRGKTVLRYIEDVSKARHGGLKHRKKLQKVVDAYPNEKDCSRCVVELYKKYVSLCPSGAKAFYVRPLPKKRPGQWYGIAPVGVHTIASTVSRMAAAAGLPGFRTNHSLRATAATRLYRQNVSEQLIKETTGHSSDAVQAYKRTSEEQKEAVSRVLQCNEQGSADAKDITIRTGDRKTCTFNISCKLNIL